MRVLIVEHKEIWGGGQVALVNLLREWGRTGTPVEPTVVCPPNAALRARLAQLGVLAEEALDEGLGLLGFRRVLGLDGWELLHGAQDLRILHGPRHRGARRRSRGRVGWCGRYVHG